MPVAAVTGLAAEAVIAQRTGLRAVASGGDSARTRALAAELIAAGASGLLSFGICGGLDPALGSGRLVLPLAVRDEAGAQLAVDPVWHRAAAVALADAGLSAATGDLLGAAAIIATPQQKRLYHARGGVAADLESHLVGAAAAAAGLPFLALRAVADPAWRRLPPAALVGLGIDGRPALGEVLVSIVRHPGQLPALLRVARETRAALGALRRAAPVLGAVGAGR